MKDITVYFVAPHRKASCDNLIKYLKSSMYVKKTTKILVPEDPIFLEVELDNRYFSDGFPILRRIIFVKNLNQVPNKSKYFIDFECLLRWAKGRDMIPNTKNTKDEELVAYYITNSPIVDSHNMRDLLMLNKTDVLRCNASGNWDPPCLIVTTVGEDNIVENRRLYFVKSKGQISPTARFFIRYDNASNWALGRDDIIPDKEDLHYNHSTPIISKWIPTVKRIEQNVKRGDIYTTVFWEDDSKPTIVKARQGEPTSIYSAVAAAISIKTYGSNSAFKRMIREKVVVSDKENK